MRATAMKTTMRRLMGALGLMAGLLLGLAAQAGTVTYYHNDLAGSPVVATNAAGQVIWRESYRPYGERTVNSAASSSNKVWFTSRRQDPETGLVYMGARYYDPVVGRFVSTDPVLFDEKNLHSFNRYAYANNNPYRYVDPDGRMPVDAGFAVWDTGKLAGALGAWTVGAITGDVNLQAAAIEGMRETRLDAALSVGAIMLPVSPNAARGAKIAGEVASDAAAHADKFSRTAKSLMDEMVLGAAKEGKGIKIIDNLGDPKFKGMEKWSYGETSAAGVRSEVHYVRDPKSGDLMDFKFKHHAETYK
jgi:RHS repeat-associated protein